MSKTVGALIFANNSNLDYLRLAKINAGLIKKHLNIDTTIVTEEYYKKEYVRDTNNLQINWNIWSRPHAYDISPYDHTLLLDADCLMFDPSILLYSSLKLGCYRDVHDLTGSDFFHSDRNIGQFSLTMYWCTLLWFSKCKEAKAMFSYMKDIRNHHDYYSLAFNYPTSRYRNDYALSVALQVLAGNQEPSIYTLPGKLFTLPNIASIIDVRDNGELIYSWENNVSKIQNTNVHIMNKELLQDERILLRLEQIANV